MSKILIGTSYKGYPNKQYTNEKYLTSLVIKEMQIMALMKYHYTLI